MSGHEDLEPIKIVLKLVEFCTLIRSQIAVQPQS